MTHLTRNLADILKNVCRPGDFSTTGRCEIFAPRLEVDGVGLIALPLLPAQAEALVAVAEQAPYGRGGDTLIDTAVRRTWQIGADRVHLGGRHWDKHLADIVARCKAGLGVSEPVSAELYKLLVYDTGSFFVSHRDTEKAPGMFATLVVVLPSIYTGGELCIRHREREVCLDLSSPEPSEVAYAAFYADCRHEVRPITAGCRLVLVYNLIRHGSGRPLGPPAYDAEIERISDLLRSWAAEPAAAERSSPSKLIYPLEHAYTPAEIGFRTLKGADAAVASVLVSAAGRANCELHLAFLAIRESGSAEYYGSWSRGRRHSEPDDDDFEVLDVSDSASTLSGWQAPDGSRPSLGEMSFADAELCPPGAMEDEEPDEQHFFEATGNEGASFERSYRRAALVLWPQAGKLQVIAAAGHGVSLPYLAALTERWVEHGERSGVTAMARGAATRPADHRAAGRLAHFRLAVVQPDGKRRSAADHAAPDGRCRQYRSLARRSQRRGLLRRRRQRGPGRRGDAAPGRAGRRARPAHHRPKCAAADHRLRRAAATDGGAIPRPFGRRRGLF
jgi:predicted 2-oxoglutarate/Fe(II)-dependent dioxygenase YbiX